jgi:hypothetical protein
MSVSGSTIPIREQSIGQGKYRQNVRSVRMPFLLAVALSCHSERRVRALLGARAIK